MRNLFNYVLTTLSALYRLLHLLADRSTYQRVEELFSFLIKQKDEMVYSTMRAAALIIAACKLIVAAWEHIRKVASAYNNFTTLRGFKKTKQGKAKKTVQEVYTARCANAKKARAGKAAKRNRTPEKGFVSSTPVSTCGGVVEIPADRHFD